METYDVLLELSEDERKTFNAFQKEMEPYVTTGRAKKFCNNITYVRYLRARNFDIDKASKMLQTTLQWREDNKPELITAAEVKGELYNQGKTFRLGKDKKGRPIVVMKPRHDNTINTATEAEKMRAVMYIMEKTIRSMDEEKTGITKMVLLIDFKGWSQTNAFKNPNTSFLNILQNHYPERLEKAFVFHQPFYFNIFWGLLSPFLDKKTKDKIVLLGGSKGKIMFPQLLEFVDVEQLEPEYGGTSTFVFDPDRDWDKEEKEFPVEKE